MVNTIATDQGTDVFVQDLQEVPNLVQSGAPHPYENPSEAPLHDPKSQACMSQTKIIKESHI